MATVTGIEELLQFMQNQANAAKEKAQRQANIDTRKELEDQTKKIVNRWYGYYSPEIYSRSGNLQNFEIQDDGDGFWVDFSQEIASHQGNDYVLDLVVAQGYHGGSYGKDISGVHWRTGWHFSRWGAPAHMSPPIIDDVNVKVDELNSKNEEKAGELFDQYFGAGW